VIHDGIEVCLDAEQVASRAARFVCESAQRSVAQAGLFRFAFSGGTTPWRMFSLLASMEMPWKATQLYQVDERVAPDDDPERNLTHLLQCLKGISVSIHPMPVTSSDLVAAAATYASQLPTAFDLVHLGLGVDGHTASLLPGDPLVEETKALVGVTGTYQGHRRMSLTLPVLDAADQVLWLISGAEKFSALEKLRAGDTSIPAGRVHPRHSLMIVDQAALGETGATS
jgi:6-phosphogluconolactonase